MYRDGTSAAPSDGTQLIGINQRQQDPATIPAFPAIYGSTGILLPTIDHA